VTLPMQQPVSPMTASSCLAKAASGRGLFGSRLPCRARFSGYREPFAIVASSILPNVIAVEFGVVWVYSGVKAPVANLYLADLS
jgi:hypothetical protein